MKKALLTMGLPGGGKTTIMNTYYNDLKNNSILIDPDEIKKEMSDYNPLQPHIYHDWSKKEANVRITKAIKRGENLIIDGTGTNIKKMTNYIDKLKEANYNIEIAYVKVNLETAITRNKTRDRVVDKNIILNKYEMIEKSYNTLSKIANTKIIYND